jgi:hypothetical protein
VDFLAILLNLVKQVNLKISWPNSLYGVSFQPNHIRVNSMWIGYFNGFKENLDDQ